MNHLHLIIRWQHYNYANMRKTERCKHKNGNSNILYHSSHPAGTSEKRTLIDQRIESLEASWRHAIPFNARTNVGTTAMAFDNSEDRL